MAAIPHSGHVLQFSLENLWRDREILMAAIKQDGRNIEF